MLRRLAPSLALLLAGACGAPSFGPPRLDGGVQDSGVDAGWVRSGTVSLTLGTWNIQQFPKTATTSRAVREILDLMDADLLGIQEIVEPRAFTELVAALPDWEGIRVEEPFDFLAVGLLYRPDRVRILESRPIFTEDPYSFPRPPLWAKVEALGPRGEVVFDFELLVVHLKAQGDDRSQDRRARACAQLETWVRTRQNQGTEDDFVIVGDWNDRLDDIAERNVFLPFLLAPERYRFLSWPLAEAGEASYILFPGLIDHILITADASDEYGPGITEVIRLDETYPGYVPWVSDHRPVLSTFLIR